MTDKEAFFLGLVRQGILSVSADGKVVNTTTGKCIGAVSSHGYVGVSAKDHSAGKIRHMLVHRLVWLSFFGEIPEGYVINHKNGDKLDNGVDNLEITTASGNALHAFSTGLKNRPTGSRNTQAKLTESLVSELRSQYASCPFNIEGKAKSIGVSKVTLFLALTGKTWKHVDAPSVPTNHTIQGPR